MNLQVTLLLFYKSDLGIKESKVLHIFKTKKQANKYV